MFHIYIKHLHKTNTIVFNVLSPIKQAKCHLLIVIIARVIEFGYPIYFQVSHTAGSARYLKVKYNGQIKQLHQF